MAAIAVLLTGMSATAVVAAPEGAPGSGGPPGDVREFVLSPEGNHLWAYDAATGAHQLVIQAVNGADPGAAPPPRSDHRDINGQVCVSPDGKHAVAGEDTVLAGPSGGSSHDPRIAGWGYFRLHGDELGDISAIQVGKLAPETAGGPGYTGDPDNYGCGFLDHRRLLTTAIGNTLPGEPANGQLFLWFGPFDAGYRPETSEDGTGFFVGEVPHCAIDNDLATAGGIAIDRNGDVYVATNRPDGEGSSSGVWRFRGTFPSSPAECTPEFLAANLTRTLVVPVPANPLADPMAPTPSAVALSPDDTLYVSSVFSGTVSEFSKEGQWLRDIYPVSPVAPRTGPIGNTPYGLAFTAAGDLWIADLGIIGASPAPGEGAVIRVPRSSGPAAAPPQTIRDGLTFPDGLGVYAPRSGAGNATSEWGCGNWGMYGRTLTRQFSSECPTAISPASVSRLRPAWSFRVPLDTEDQATFTASPIVVDGVAYIGSWNGVFYALDTDDGSVVWEYETVPATGATFGPIVSSAAVADLDLPGRGHRRVVVFGAGPRVYALDAATGEAVWVTHVGAGVDGEPAEVESSPLIVDGRVFVGRDVHNQGGDESHGIRGGLLELDATSGEVRWTYEPEAAAGQPASGCGGVWGSPTYDAGSGLLYFGTANCPAVNGNPALPMEEITAIDLDRRRVVWTFRPHQPAGQASYTDEDEDFGATPNLFVDSGGRTVLGAGSKDGGYYALDPATGTLLWTTHVSDPAPGVGGFIGSPAVWQGNVFGATAIGTPPAFHSLSGTDGAVRWQGGTVPSYAASAVTNGVVFSGALDGTLKAYDAASGNVLWVSPTLGPVSSGPAIVGDLLIVGAGTSTSDLCAKGRPDSAICFFVFDTLLGQQGGVHAFRLPASALPSFPPGGLPDE